MLHFPSKNTAAHRPAPTDVTRLHQLLGDHVWAFSNCRVDAPGLQVAEVDWLFYNSVKGTFILSEWKRYPAPVAQVRDSGEKWVLTSGVEVANPIEQVTHQLEAVRRALRLKVAPVCFPTGSPHDINPYPSVYSPQVGPATLTERLRFCAVHGLLEELGATVDGRWSPTPQIPAEGVETLLLAETLAELFRCSISAAVRRTLTPAAPARPDPAARIAAIHREMAALHLELASLIQGADVQAPAEETAAVEPVSRPEVPPTTSAKAGPSPMAAHLRKHVTRLVPASTPDSGHLRDAFLAALQDGQLRSSGVHVGLFGALVGQHLTGGVKLADLAPGGLRKWCHAQAEAAGVLVVQDLKDPAIVRLTRPADQRKELT